jgi:hybrid cluster-associated redox disulfide protein
MKVTKKNKIREIIEKKPETISVFQKHGMGCFGCSAAALETVEDAAQVHGIDLDSLIEDLNKA